MTILKESIANLKRIYEKSGKPAGDAENAIWKMIGQRLKTLVGSFAPTEQHYEGMTTEGYKLNISQDKAREGAVNFGAHRSKNVREESYKLKTIRMEKDGLPFYIQQDADNFGCKVFIDMAELMKEYNL